MPPNRRSLIKNIAFVYLLQASNYLIAFVSTPYLARVLDVAGYGAYSYALSTNAYLWMVIDWGCGVGAVREVASIRSDPTALREVFWRTISGRIVLVAPAIVLLLILAFVGRANNPLIIIASGLITIAGAVVSSDWLVQGLERMGLYLVTSVLGRAASLALTLLLVRRPEDMWIAAIIHGLGGLFAGWLGFMVAVSLFKLGRPQLLLRAGAKWMWQLRHYFIARSNGLLYISAAPVILGIVSTSTALGLYAGADKIARIAVTLIGPLTVALSPRIFAMMQTSKEDAGLMSGRIMLVQMAGTVVLAAGLYVFSDQITRIVLGSGFEESAHIIRLLAAMPILIGLTASLSNHFLVPLGRVKDLSRFTVASGCLYVLGLFVFGSYAGAQGAALAYIAAELCLVFGYTGILLMHEKAYLTSAFRVTARPK